MLMFMIMHNTINIINMSYFQMESKNEARQVMQLFRRTSLKSSKEKNEFRCSIYYLKLSGLQSIKHIPDAKEAIKFILTKAKIPVYYVLDVRFPIQNCFDTAIIYFTNCYLRNAAKTKLDCYFKNHFATCITID